MIVNNSLGKTERLCSAKVINELFKNGRKFNNYPFRIFWKLSDTADLQCIRILVAVPKKNIAKAIQRNLIRRRIREIYRKNKGIFYNGLTNKTSKSLDIAFIFADNNILDYYELENRVISTFQKLGEFL
jgi:ribonuclease P protein component